MLRNIFFLGVILSIVVAGVALADGGFFGRITYKNCNCQHSIDRDVVEIWSATGGQHYFYGVDCRYGGGYNTQSGVPQTFPPGNYYLVVTPRGNSNCDCGLIELVYHGSDWQEVNLVVLGPTPTPNGGEGEE